MDIASFREHFAQIPRHVAVLAIKEEDAIHGVTISSLQSVSVEQDKQILTFVLKKNSLFSEKLIKKGQLSINFLGTLQMKLAQIYSSNDRGEVTNHPDDVWKAHKADLVYIESAPLCISGTLINMLEIENSNIYFVSADEILKTNESEMLLYGNRVYGSFKAAET
jgi:flavin reductase (DIM6/NTAB) family NADH-FMN oxidoreductase RutF